MGGELQIVDDWFAEIVGYWCITNEPPVKEVAVSSRICWPLHSLAVIYCLCRVGALGIAEGDSMRCGGARLQPGVDFVFGGAGLVRRGREGGGWLCVIQWGGCNQGRG